MKNLLKFKAMLRIAGIIAIVAMIGFSMTACGDPPGEFVAVENITGVPTSMTAGTPLSLTGTVVPEDATNKTIVWSVKSAGTTASNANISGSSLVVSPTATGNVVVTATIADGTAAGTPYTQDFTIAVGTQFRAVTGITGVPATATVGTALTLTGTVAPANATNSTIVWSVQSAGTTGATITGSTFNATATGTATVTATIANGATASTPYTQDFTITVSAGDAPPPAFIGLWATNLDLAFHFRATNVGDFGMWGVSGGSVTSPNNFVWTTPSANQIRITGTNTGTVTFNWSVSANGNTLTISNASAQIGGVSINGSYTKR